MVLNAMAILAVVRHYDLPINAAIAKLETFEAVSGRGRVIETAYQDIPITLYDDAYNANPLSMQAALKTFEQVAIPAQKKVVILGDMLELGNASMNYHLQLTPVIKAMAVRVLILVGKQSKILVDALTKSGMTPYYFQDINALRAALPSLLKEYDHVLTRASHGVGLHTVFASEQEEAVHN